MGDRLGLGELAGRLVDEGPERNFLRKTEEWAYCHTMKIIVRNLILVVALAATTAFAGVPPVNVTVSASGKPSFKGKTDAKGSFATAKLTPGEYVVQFNSSSAELKGKKYAVVVSAGKKKVSASVPGEKFAGGGVAMKVDVGSGLNITGVVAADDAPVSKNNKKMVWIAPELGSNMPGRWVEEDSAEAKIAKSRGTISRDKVREFQDKSSAPSGN